MSDAPKTKTVIREWLVGRLADEMGIRPETIDPRESFDNLGLSSREAVSLSGDLEDWLARKLSPTLLWEYPSIDLLSDHLGVDAPQARHAESNGTQSVHRNPNDPVAIVGLGCRFPGAHGPEEFWSLLVNGIDSIRDVPVDRWNSDEFFDPTPGTRGKMYTKRGGFLDHVDRFDAEFFGITSREAARMDPQQRLVMETAWESLEDACIPPDSLAGTSTGVFIGISSSDYGQIQFSDPNLVDAYAGTGSAHSLAANRLSYFLDLRGPSIAVDTACSSSLVAVHQAVASLRRGECQLALTGGVNVIVSPEVSIVFSHARMMAPDGRCKTFDASADGYVRGEGCGVVVLKRLDDAITDGDHVYGVIRGTAVNHDGRSNGLTAPNGLAQQAVIRQALQDAKLNPSDIDYVEAHGTGTSLGDPIEVDSLKAVLLADRPEDRTCVIGSLKTNIGHLEAAAGIAGLIKSALMLDREHIPAHLHLKQLNPLIELDGTAMHIVTELTSWRRTDRPRRAGVSSFGFGGANAHVVVEEAPEKRAADSLQSESPVHVLALSAKSDDVLRELARSYSRAIPVVDDSLANLACTMNVGRAHHEHRLAVIARTKSDAIRSLDSFASANSDKHAVSGTTPRSSDRKVAFLFTGQGAQYIDMGRGLYESYPTFKRALDECAEAVDSMLEVPLRAVLFDEDGNGALLNETVYTQPALFAIEYALAELWISWGIRPQAVLGHSVGEYVAACVAGVFSMQDGIRLIASRARLMQSLPAGGAMAAVLAPREIVERMLAGLEDKLSLAAINGPTNTVISGDGAALESVLAKLRDRGIASRKLAVSHAFHSPLLEPMLDAFEREAKAVRHRSPGIPIASNLSGRLETGDARFDSAYWRAHARNAVQFETGIQSLLEAGFTTFLEIGPAPVLTGMGTRCTRRSSGAWIPSLAKGTEDCESIANAVANLYVHGIPVDWGAFSGGRRRPCTLPTYPFRRSRHWLDRKAIKHSEITEPLPVDVFGHTEHGLNGLSSLLYELRWRANSHRESSSVGHGHWLIFGDRAGIADDLVERIRRLGIPYTIVHTGQDYKEIDSTRVEIDPRNLSHFEQVFKRLPSTLSRIVHLWSIDTVPSSDLTAEGIDQAQVLGCLAALNITKALSSHSASSHANRLLWFVTRGAQVVHSSNGLPAIHQAPLWGFGRCVAAELPALWGGLVDLESNSTGASLLLEATLAPDEEDQIAFRSATRYVARLHSVAQEYDGLTSSITCTDNGAYLITGGLGGLGLRVAEWLVSQGARHLVLLGRSALPLRSTWSNASHEDGVQRRIQAILALESSGVDVQCESVDVGDAASLRSFLRRYKESGAPEIRGVVHAAGVLDDQAVTHLDAESLDRVLAPKISGGWALHESFKRDATNGTSLDFFVLFSSVTSMLGSPGQANYAAANAFLDSLAHYRQMLGETALCINWGPWAEIGMAATPEFTRRFSQSGIRSISPGDGVSLLHHLIAADTAQIGVLDADWDRVRSAIPTMARAPWLRDLCGDGKGVPLETKPSSTSTSLIDHEGIEAYLRRQLARILYRDEESISIDSDFIDLGVDSIMMMEVIQSIEQDLGIRLFPKEVMDRPTIVQLARYVAGEIATGAKPIAQSDPSAVVHLPTARHRGRHLSFPAKRLDPVVFLLSSPRSGSTLLRVMLAGLPGLFCPPELHLLRFGTMREWHAELGGTYLGEGLQRAIMDLLGVDAAEAKRIVDDYVVREVPVHEVYAMLQEKLGARLLVDKSPSYGSEIETLESAEQIFDGAKFIHLVRHPYTTIESFVRNRFDRLISDGADDPLTMGETVWAQTNANVRDFLSGVEPARQLLVYYEDLVSSPEQSMRSICSFLGVPFHPDALTPYEGSRMTDGVHAKSASIGDPNFNKRNRIEASLGDAWKHVRLPRRLNGFARRVATELDYELPVELRGEPVGQREGAIQHVVAVQPKGAKPPFFCCAPASGIAYTYFNLPQYMAEDQPFYALQDPALSPSVEPFDTVEGLAASHVLAIRAIQPKGPYYLGGWSFGGTVAFEIAQQLMAAGEEVALLAIIDAEARIDANRARSLKERIFYVSKQSLMCLHVVTEIGPYLRDFFYMFLPSRANRRRVAGDNPTTWEYIRWAWADAIRHRLLRRADIASVVSRDSRLMLIRQPRTRRTLSVLSANLKSLLKYDPKPYPGHITLLRAEDQSVMHKLHSDPTLGWSEIAGDRLAIIEVPGNHAVLMIKPYIETVGKVLNESIVMARSAHEQRPANPPSD